MRYAQPILHAIWFWGLIGPCSSCWGQVNDQYLNIIKGHSVSTVHKDIWSIFQDKRHNYWFGSNGQGVYRYDGKNLVQFTTSDGLCHNQVRRIQEDSDGDIYFTTGDGISKFDGQTFTTLSVAKSNSFDGKWKLAPGDLWFQGGQNKNGPYRYDGKFLYDLELPKSDLEDLFRSKFPDVSYNPYELYSIYRDKKGNIWFGTSNFGLCRYDGRSFTWITEDSFATPVRSINEDKNGNIWFGNSGQAVYCYDGKNLINFRKEQGIGNLKGKMGDALISYMSITNDSDGELWIVTYENGVWRYNGKNTTHYSVMDGNKKITLSSIYKDAQGGLWLGTNEAGVYKLNGKSFEQFKF